MYIALYDDQTQVIRYELYLVGGQRTDLTSRQLGETNKGKTTEIILTKQPILHQTHQEA